MKGRFTEPLTGVLIDTDEKKIGMKVPLREYDTFDGALRHCLTNLQYVLIASTCEQGLPLGHSKALGVVRGGHLMIGCEIRCQH